MKNLFRFLKMSFPIVALGLFTSCGGGDGNSRGNVTVIDSTEDSEVILNFDEMDSDEEIGLNAANGVQVPIEESTNFNWKDFRNQLQAIQKAIGEGYHMGVDEVATSWEKHNEKYSYQTVYKYRDNQLWLQTYYKENNATSNSDSLPSGKGQLLTQEVTQEPELAGLWEKMEEKAKNLSSKYPNSEN